MGDEFVSIEAEFREALRAALTRLECAPAYADDWTVVALPDGRWRPQGPRGWLGRPVGTLREAVEVALDGMAAGGLVEGFPVVSGYCACGLVVRAADLPAFLDELRHHHADCPVGGIGG